MTTVTNGKKFNDAAGALKFTSLPVYGDVYFANNADTNSAAAGGQSRSTPAATLMQAQALCNAPTNLSAYGDFVYVGAGHAENVTAAGMTFAIPGVTYIGQGNGRLRPKLTWTATASQAVLSGQGVSFQNFVFDFTGIDAVVAAMSLQAADVSMINCDLICNTATAGVIRGIYANTSGSPADRLLMSNCRIIGTQTNSGTTTTAAVDIEYGASVQILDTQFSGKATQHVLNATTCLDWFIGRNSFHTYTGTKSISLAAGTTGFGFRNSFAVASGTAPIVGAGFTWSGNVYSTEALTIGTPTATAF